jgi:hypothetical protein
LPPAVFGGKGIDKREAVLNRREARHTLEQVPRGALRQQAGGKRDEGMMHVKWGNRRGDAIDVGCRHERNLSSGVYTVRCSKGDSLIDWRQSNEKRWMEY